MRKLAAVFALFMVGVMPAFAGCNSPVTLSYVGTQKPEHDEFLYENGQQYALARAGYDNSSHKNSGDGYGYECDGFYSGSCTSGDTVTMKPGHVFKGEPINKTVTYKCVTGPGVLGAAIAVIGAFQLDDRWVPIDEVDEANNGNNGNKGNKGNNANNGNKAGNADKNDKADKGNKSDMVERCATKGFGDIAVGDCVGGSPNCRRLTSTDCSGYQKSDVSGTVFHGVCEENARFVCKAIECREGLTADKSGICVANGKKKNSGGASSKSSCQTRRTTAEGKACCTLPKEDAVWTGKTDSDAAGKCVCTNDRTEFKIQNGRGVCAAKEFVIDEADDGVYKCQEGVLTALNAWVKDEDTPQEAMSLIRELLALCDEDAPNKDRVDDLWGQIVLLIHVRDDSVVNVVDIQIDTQRVKSKTSINSAYDKTQTIVAGWGRSVWRDKDGNFNKARLVSDSVAGVVLGTVGAVVTSNVIKKSQLKKGFEDISCSIGGQTVAGWGDEINVGLKK